jgi:LppX/LprAFG-like lipoprotein
MGAKGAHVLMRKALLVALVLPLAACGGGSKSNGRPSNMTPVAYLKSSAAKTAQTPGEHVTLKGSLTVGGTLVTIDGAGNFDNAKKLGSMHADFSAGGLSGTLDEVLNGTTIYLQSPLLTSNLPNGKTWLKLDLQKAAPKGVDLSALTTQSPTKLLSQLQAAGNVTTVGDETINGTATTHYRAKLDLSKLPKVAAPANATYAPIDIWIGKDDGYVHRIHTAYTLKVASAAAQAIAVTVDFSDFGKSVSVSIPAASATADGTGRAIPGLGG